jgi:hypothetical protein
MCGEWALIRTTHNMLKLWTALRQRRQRPGEGAAGRGQKLEDGAENSGVVERCQVNPSVAGWIWDSPEHLCCVQVNVGQPPSPRPFSV